MERDKLVSVIIPVYNVRPYLSEALESVLGQTYEHLEIIIVDDGSTDGSSEICDQYAKRDSRVRVIHQQHRGLSAARNAGLDAMHGQMVAFLDSDDAYCPFFVEHMAAALKNEAVQLAICRYTRHFTKGSLVSDGANKAKLVPAAKPGVYDRTEALRVLADGSIEVCVWNKLYVREVWDGIRFPDGHVYEDLSTTFKVFDQCVSICMLDEQLYKHRKRSGSITQTSSLENESDLIEARLQFASFVESRVPEVYTIDDLKRFQRSQCNAMAASYCRYSRQGGRGDKASCEKLRKQIVEAGEKLNADELGIRARVAYRMMRSCPWLLTPTYQLYHPFRALVRRIVGR